MSARRRKRAKKWVPVYAADVIAGEWIGDALASDATSLTGRQVEVVLRDVTGDFEHERYKLWFSIYKTDAERAYARFTKEMLSYDYVRSIVQRRSSSIDITTQGETADGHLVAVFYIIITAVRARHSQEREIRRRVREYLSSLIPQLSLEELVRALLFGEKHQVSGEARKIATKVIPIKNADTRKISILRHGKAEPAVERVMASIESSTPSSGEGEEA